MRRLLLAMLMTGAAGSAAAEVVERREDGYRLRNTVTVHAATPEAAYAAIGEVGRWWDGAHTYSGDAANLSMTLQPGGCFCEALPGGGVEHGRVVLAWPAQGLVRIHGALGPLQSEGVSASLTFQVTAREGGGVEIVQTYNVGGDRPEGAAAAPLVDQVLRIQLERLGRYVATGSAAAPAQAD